MAERNTTTSTRNCESCGAEFSPAGSRSYFCSSECSFWAKVDKSGPASCWNWNAAVGKPGYGTFCATDGTFHGAHRYSWMLANGAIPEGKFVCHKCDNRKCVNPRHLFLGSPADNCSDMWGKGRQHDYSTMQRGTKRHNAKLDSGKVRAMRAMHPQSTLTEIAKEFDVSLSTASSVIRRKTWAHVR